MTKSAYVPRPLFPFHASFTASGVCGEVSGIYRKKGFSPAAAVVMNWLARRPSSGSIGSSVQPSRAGPCWLAW